MLQPVDHSRACLLFNPTELAYKFGEEHPMQPGRLVALMDLLESSGLWKPGAYQLPLRAATEEELRLVHTPDYIAAVQRLSLPEEMIQSQQEREELQNLALRGKVQKEPILLDNVCILHCFFQMSSLCCSQARLWEQQRTSTFEPCLS
jgi:acetoin utilization deacetylase AcuC-like enzyme